MFRQASAGISKAKLHRYTAEEIIALNQYRADDYTRECKVCKRIGQVDEKGVCPLCRKIEALSKNVLYDTFFSIVLEGEQEGLPLPGGYRMVTDDEKSLKKENGRGYLLCENICKKCNVYGETYCDKAVGW